MITLKQAIDVLDLKDNDMVYLVKERFEHFAPLVTVKQIREKYDMQRTKVLKIYPYHFQYDADDDTYELLINRRLEKWTM